MKLGQKLMESCVVSGQDERVSWEEPVFEVPELRDTSPQIRAAFKWMDTADVEELFRRRAAVLRSVPHFLRGPFRVALHTALAEAIADLLLNMTPAAFELDEGMFAENVRSARKGAPQDHLEWWLNISDRCWTIQRCAHVLPHGRTVGPGQQFVWGG